MLLNFLSSQERSTTKAILTVGRAIIIDRAIKNEARKIKNNSITRSNKLQYWKNKHDYIFNTKLLRILRTPISFLPIVHNTIS